MGGSLRNHLPIKEKCLDFAGAGPGRTLPGETPRATEIAALLASAFPGFSAEGFIRSDPILNPPAPAAIRAGARRVAFSEAAIRVPLDIGKAVRDHSISLPAPLT